MSSSLVSTIKSHPLQRIAVAAGLFLTFIAGPVSAQKTSPTGSPTAAPARTSSSPAEKTAPARSPGAAKPAADNPLITESTLPYQYPPFDKIKNEHFAPAFTQGFKAQLQEVEAIANNPEEPTFENTLVAMEKTGQLLARVGRIFFSLAGANTNPEIQKIETDVAPRLAAHQDAIQLNPKLFARIQALHDRRDQLGLDPEAKQLLERYYTDFVRAGAKLSEEEKTRLKAMNAELASLQTKFTQALLKEKNASAVLVDNRADLAGMSDPAIAAAAKAAEEAGKKGKFLIPLQNTTGQPPLAELTDRALRERIMKASLSRNSKGGEFDTRAMVIRIARLRAERANLLGYDNHAAYQLEDQTAKNVGTVNKMLADITPLAVENAKREAADLQAMIEKEKGDFELKPWDWAFYAEKVMKDKYAFDESQVKPYFEVDRVLRDGVFYAAEKVYGLTFKERTDLPVYEEGVRVFEVFDADAKPLALFITDLYARASKRGGAWMNDYVPQTGLFGWKPVVANHQNIPKPPKGEPTLLTFDEVTTMFHEFGHALHGMLSDVKYPRFSGTNVPRDFVEFPSQVNEMWAVWPEVLKNYAKHYKTGEPMPQELLDKLLESENFNQGFKTTEYLAATLIDQDWHQIRPDQIPDDVLAFEAESLKKHGIDFEPVPPRYRTPYFSHSFSGDYSAGYYSYIWSEVLDAQTVKWFKEHGGMTRENGDRFRRTLLSRGGSEDPLQQFKNFTGSDPDVGPLLERRGLTAVAPMKVPPEIPQPKPPHPEPQQ